MGEVWIYIFFFVNYDLLFEVFQELHLQKAILQLTDAFEQISCILLPVCQNRYQCLICDY